MKKLLGILAISALAVSSYAQGTVVFNNGSGTLVKQWTSTSDSTLITTPKSGGRVELIAAPGNVSLANPLFTSSAAGNTAKYDTLAAFLGANPGWAAIATTPILSLSAGQFAGGNQTIASLAAGANANYLIIGWSGSYATLDLALAAAQGNTALSFLGSTPMFTTATGNPLTTPAGTPTALNVTFTGMTLAPLVVPEPASFALAGLGLAALLVFRRRS